MTTIHAYAASEPKATLKPFEYSLGAIGDDEVDIAVHACGICHSDLSVLDNDWGITKYPLVPGHEVVGKIAALGKNVKHLSMGQMVGVGWYSRSCMHCRTCMHGDHNLCESAEGIMIGRYGGFADRVRVQAAWATPLPAGVDPNVAGPLFCGGITVFNPIVQLNIRPTQRVGVIGIGGLGHLALQFLNKWGCEVTAFSSTPGKEAEIKKLGAHKVVNSRDSKALEGMAGSLDVIISTVNVKMEWDGYMKALRPRGKFHHVGAVLEPMPVTAMTLISGAKSISGSPLGSPATIADMLDFCARHQIVPVTEIFAMNKVNEALAHLRSGKARYRVVLKAGE